MTVAALVAAALAGIVLPHLLRFERANPAAAIVLWCAALGLRALVVVGTVAGALVLLHPAELMQAFAQWPCAPHHHVAGHALAAAGGLALSLSFVWAMAAWCRRRSSCAVSSAGRSDADRRAASSSAARTSCSLSPG